MTAPLGVVLIIGFSLVLIVLIAARSNRRARGSGASGSGSDAAAVSYIGDSDCGSGDAVGDCGGDGGVAATAGVAAATEWSYAVAADRDRKPA